MKALVKGRLDRLSHWAKPARSWGCGWLLALGTYAKLLAQQQPPSGTVLPLSITILYFDQSSHQLRPGVKTTLDSIARLLVSQSTLMAALTGYSDQVGQRELNRALAKDRAKTVATYLQQRGVAQNQLVVNWEGAEIRASADESKGIQTISRRVALLLYPR
jgi:outer membrane protein OmpA-like peptidoglycan-associated protein